jgi:hypothetical protein
LFIEAAFTFRVSGKSLASAFLPLNKGRLEISARAISGNHFLLIREPHPNPDLLKQFLAGVA